MTGQAGRGGEQRGGRIKAGPGRRVDGGGEGSGRAGSNTVAVVLKRCALRRAVRLVGSTTGRAVGTLGAAVETLKGGGVLVGADGADAGLGSGVGGVKSGTLVDALKRVVWQLHAQSGAVEAVDRARASAAGQATGVVAGRAVLADVARLVEQIGARRAGRGACVVADNKVGAVHTESGARAAAAASALCVARLAHFISVGVLLRVTAIGTFRAVGHGFDVVDASDAVIGRGPSAPTTLGVAGDAGGGVGLGEFPDKRAVGQTKAAVFVVSAGIARGRSTAETPVSPTLGITGRTRASAGVEVLAAVAGDGGRDVAVDGQGPVVKRPLVGRAQRVVNIQVPGAKGRLVPVAHSHKRPVDTAGVVIIRAGGHEHRAGPARRHELKDIVATPIAVHIDCDLHMLQLDNAGGALGESV